MVIRNGDDSEGVVNFVGGVLFICNLEVIGIEDVSMNKVFSIGD